MTLSEFKLLLEQKKRGDIKLPTENDAYKVLLQESLESIAKKIVILELVTTDATEDILRWLNKTKAIRRPISTSIDEDDIDMPNSLCYAVVYDFLMKRTTDFNRVSFYKALRDEETNTYKWNNFALLQELEENNYATRRPIAKPDDCYRQ